MARWVRRRWASSLLIQPTCAVSIVTLSTPYAGTAGETMSNVIDFPKKISDLCKKRRHGMWSWNASTDWSTKGGEPGSTSASATSICWLDAAGDRSLNSSGLFRRDQMIADGGGGSEAVGTKPDCHVTTAARPPRISRMCNFAVSRRATIRQAAQKEERGPRGCSNSVPHCVQTPFPR